MIEEDAITLATLACVFKLTGLHPVGDHVLWSGHDVHVSPQSSVEGLHLMYGHVQDGVSGGVVVVYTCHSAFDIDAVYRRRKRGEWKTTPLGIVEHRETEQQRAVLHFKSWTHAGGKCVHSCVLLLDDAFLGLQHEVTVVLPGVREVHKG